MKILVLTALFSSTLMAAQSQTTIDRDPEIAGMVKEVNADSLQSYIKTMVFFGTRSTVSSTSDGSRGIGAARNWVLMKFREFAAVSGGRMTAVLDTTTYPDLYRQRPFGQSPDGCDEWDGGCTGCE